MPAAAACSRGENYKVHEDRDRAVGSDGNRHAQTGHGSMFISAHGP